MQRGPGIRLALVTALLLGHLWLPAAHVAAVAAGEHAALAAAGAQATLTAATQPSRHAGAHDPNLCPICLASSQARSGVRHAVPAGQLRHTPVLATPPREPALALPRAPALDSAPPRAPPARALAFA